MGRRVFCGDRLVSSRIGRRHRPSACLGAGGPVGPKRSVLIAPVSCPSRTSLGHSLNERRRPTSVETRLLGRSGRDVGQHFGAPWPGQPGTSKTIVLTRGVSTTSSASCKSVARVAQPSSGFTQPGSQ
jgi:hypothetical protein